MTSVSEPSAWTLNDFTSVFTIGHEPISESWFLMNPAHLFTILTSYLIFILYLGPKLMKNRPPMDLRKVMIVYNIIQVAVNLYFVQVVVKECVLTGRLNVFCEGKNKDFQENMDFVLSMIHQFYLSRLFDLLDTVFMVLKKKDKQMSFLHIYHHILMGTVAWIGTYTGLGARAVLFAILNCTVHSVMYSYYLLMVLRPEYKKMAWWKKNITQLQLLQFIILMLQAIVSAFNPSCDRAQRIAAAIFFPQILFITTLFADFYYKAYVKKGSSKKE